MQLPDRIARRGQATFAGWCPSAVRCCSLRSKLRSPGGQACVLRDDRGESSPDTQEHATLLFSLRSAMRPGRKRCCWCRTVVCVVVTTVAVNRSGLALVLRHPLTNFDEAPRRSRRSFRRSWTLGPVWRPVDLAQPDHTAARGQPSTGPAPASYRSALGLPCGSPQGRSMGCHTLLADLPQQCSARPILETCRGAGRRAPAVGSLEPGIRPGARHQPAI